MSVTLYMAVSADGFIARTDNTTPWSDDEWAAWKSFVTSCDVILLGRKTYEIMRDDGNFIRGPRYIVVTNNASFNAGDYQTLQIKTAADMPQANKIGLIGGGELNGNLAALGVIDNVIIDIESIVFGEGKRLLGTSNTPLNLELVKSVVIGAATVQNHYKIIKG